MTEQGRPRAIANANPMALLPDAIAELRTIRRTPGSWRVARIAVAKSGTGPGGQQAAWVDLAEYEITRKVNHHPGRPPHVSAKGVAAIGLAPGAREG